MIRFIFSGKNIFSLEIDTALGVQFHPEEAVRKHLTCQPDAARFMPLDEAVAYFRALIGAAR